MRQHGWLMLLVVLAPIPFLKPDWMPRWFWSPDQQMRQAFGTVRVTDPMQPASGMVLANYHLNSLYIDFKPKYLLLATQSPSRSLPYAYPIPYTDIEVSDEKMQRDGQILIFFRTSAGKLALDDASMKKLQPYLK